MKFKKISILLLVCALIVGIVATGCATPARRPITDTNDNNNLPMGQPNEVGIGEPNTVAPNGTTTDPNDIATPRETGDNNTNTNLGMGNETARETRIATEVNRIANVSDAMVLVNNNVAYVGIDLNGNVEDATTNAIKDRVITAVKRADNSITQVYVSADVDVVQRLRGYGTDIRGGRPISGFIDEIEEMFRRPIPRTNQ